MSGDQVGQIVVQVLVTLAFVFLVAWLRGWGAAPAARALEEVRADLARLTQASSLYVQRQHEVFTEVYRHLRLSRDGLIRIVSHPVTLAHYVKGMTKEELDEDLKKDGWPGAERRQVTDLWTPERQTEALHLLQTKAPLMQYVRAMDSLRDATNAYLGNLLYFSDAGAQAVDAVLHELRLYSFDVQYGHQRIPDAELAARETTLNERMDQVYALLRKELKEPGAK